MGAGGPLLVFVERQGEFVNAPRLGRGGDFLGQKGGDLAVDGNVVTRRRFNDSNVGDARPRFADATAGGNAASLGFVRGGNNAAARHRRGCNGYRPTAQFRPPMLFARREKGVHIQK